MLSGAVRIAPVGPAAQPEASGFSAGAELTPEKVSEETEEHPEPFSRCFLQPSPSQITAGGSWGKTPALKNLHLQRGEKNPPFFAPFPSLSPFQEASLLLMSSLKLFLLIHADNSILNFQAQSLLFWGVDFFLLYSAWTLFLVHFCS